MSSDTASTDAPAGAGRNATSEAAPIAGRCDERFGAVREAFSATSPRGSRSAPRSRS